MRKLNGHPFQFALPRAQVHRGGWRPVTRTFDRSALDKERAGAPGAATHPGVVPHVIIGNDDRKRITNTKSYPARAIAQLAVRFENGDELSGTGWFISPDVLVTAAHVVAGSVKVIAAAPGRDGSALPFGFANAISGPRLRAGTTLKEARGTMAPFNWTSL